MMQSTYQLKVLFLWNHVIFPSAITIHVRVRCCKQIALRFGRGRAFRARRGQALACVLAAAGRACAARSIAHSVTGPALASTHTRENKPLSSQTARRR